MVKVSVIIPCYNQGHFLSEAVESVRRQTWKDVEIIIVNDGSDDELTHQLCNSYDDPAITVVNTDNQGLASARNNGIEAASGRYILPLDADDRIAPEYIEEAISVMEASADVGIVYCRARLFGAVEGEWDIPAYSIEEMLMDNVIFCTALFRRSDWEEVGGYDPGMVYGWEDYDFWLSLIERGRTVHRLDNAYFFYRVAAESMVRSKRKEQKVEMFTRLFHRHYELYNDHIDVWINRLLDHREPYLSCRLYVGNGAGVSDADSMTRKIGKGRFTLFFPVDCFENRQALRFDPAESAVCIELHAIELTSGQDLVVDLDSVTSNAVFRRDHLFMFATDDPQLFIPVKPDHLMQASGVVITCTYTSFGEEALRTIVEEVDSERRQIKRRIPFRWFR